MSRLNPEQLAHENDVFQLAIAGSQITGSSKYWMWQGWQARASDRKTLAAEQMYKALRAVWAYGKPGETEDGTSVSYLVEEALRAAGFYEETKL